MATTMKMADPNSNNSNLYIIPVSIVLPIALVLVIARLWSRVKRTKKLYIDDWLILVAEPLSIANACIAYAAIGEGWGKPLMTLSPAQFTKTMKLQFAVQTTWIFTLCLVRVSVACSLLRFGNFERWWKWILYTIMAVQICISSSYVVIQFGQCKPISSSWERVPGTVCWNMNAIINYGWAVAAIYVTMDLILSLMPIKLIMTLNRPKSEKVLIAFLMALGLCATAVSCAKMTTFTTFGSGDPMQATILPSMYAKMEEIIGIIATSLPCLKQPLQLWLHKIGVLHTNPLSRPSFVNTVPTPDTPEMRDQRSSSEGYYPGQLMAEKRGESVSVKPGSANSNGANSNGVEKTASRKEPWESV